MDDWIQHISHHHRLTLSLCTAPNGEFCPMCRSICKGLAYTCKGCFFQIHKTCAELPQEINHLFHPQHPLTLLSNCLEEVRCGACGKLGFSSAYYHCSQCEFHLDLNCAALMPTTESSSSSSSSSHEKGGHHQLDHHVVNPHPHPHPLFLCETEKKTDFYCSGCKLVIENGSIYVCIQCKTILHKSCSQLPTQFIKHPFHPNHTLTLLPRPPYRVWFSCNVCGVEHDGFTFHCSECNFFLDINCAFLMPVSTTDINHQIDHSPHPLILCNSSKTKNKITFVCRACQLPFDDDDDHGSTMYCCLDCHYFLHKSCVDLPDEVQHPFHPNHPLKLRNRALHPRLRYSKNFDRFECKACLRENKGFAYECLGCEFSIGIPCALSAPLLVNSQLHEHPLAFFSFGIVAKDLQCNICHHFRKSPYFRCVACNFNVHVFCVPTLPPIASDGNHRHPLALTKSLVKDYEDEDEDAEFYCDRCENQRSLREPTYYCAECHYVTHVHCVIQEVVRFMEDEWSLAQKLGDKKLDASIDSCQENTNDFVSRFLIEEEEETTRPLLTNTNLHDHPLTFFRVVVDDLSCIVCHLRSHSNFFRCVPCNFNLHLFCISKLPPTIFLEDHTWHTLTLFCTRKGRYDDEDNEVSRCDACRKERLLSDPSYSCDNCQYFAHVRCALEISTYEDESLAHELGDTKFSFEENTINAVVREVLIKFSDFSQRNDDREEAIAEIRIKMKEEEEKLEQLRKKYIRKQEFKVDALSKRLEALEKRSA